MARLRFRAVIKLRIGNPYILVSAKRARALREGWRKPMPVLFQITGLSRQKTFSYSAEYENVYKGRWEKGGKFWKINMMPVGDGSFYLYLHGDVRKASKTKVGDIVEVTLRFDEAYRGGPMHPMPVWFRQPLYKNKKAKAAWDALIPSRQKEILRYLSWLKSPEARARNVAKALKVLSRQTGRYMARTWKGGR